MGSKSLTKLGEVDGLGSLDSKLQRELERESEVYLLADGFEGKYKDWDYSRLLYELSPRSTAGYRRPALPKDIKAAREEMEQKRVAMEESLDCFVDAIVTELLQHDDPYLVLEGLSRGIRGNSLFKDPEYNYILGRVIKKMKEMLADGGIEEPSDSRLVDVRIIRGGISDKLMRALGHVIPCVKAAVQARDREFEIAVMVEEMVSFR